MVGIQSPTTISNTIVQAILKLRQAASISIPSSSSSQKSSSSNKKNHHHPKNDTALTETNAINTTTTTTTITTNDSDLSASQLAQRNQFLRQYPNHNIITELKDAITMVQQYYDSIDHKDCGTVPSLPWHDWEQYISSLQQQEQQQQQIQLANMSLQQQTTTSSSSISTGSHTVPTTTTITTLSRDPTLTLSRDPTLFMGLDELLTYDEQEFITHMFISGDVELIAQAAYLLHSIMCTMMTTPSSSLSSKDNHPTRPNNSTTTNHNNKKPSKTMAQLEHEQKIRKKFPLPNHMPRVVTIPPYNPLVQLNHRNKQQIPIKFIPIPSSKSSAATKPPSSSTPKSTASSSQSQSPQQQPHYELTLAGVNGIAGRVGLRRGDIITHVNQERVHTFSEYTIAVQYALEQQEQEQQSESQSTPSSGSTMTNTMTITVNANEEIAQQLYARAQQMQQQNVRFHG
jgi:hypothetical protein